MRKRYRHLLSLAMGIATLMLLVSSELSFAETHLTLPDGSKVDLAANCPVCGMKVGGDMGGSATYSYRDNRLVGFAGMAAAVFKDGNVVGFEGARCLFIYSAIPKRFGIDVGNIVHRYVTDFPTRKMIDVKDAFLVLGSTIKGPMGREVVAFTSKGDAERFMSEHQGKRLVQFDNIVPADVERSGGLQK
jgi:nitrous oxide reductase accessory protein NosL